MPIGTDESIFRDVLLALISSAAGTIGGAYAAQKISLKRNKIETCKEEINYSFILLNILTQTINQIYSFKKNNFLPVYENFLEQLKILETESNEKYSFNFIVHNGKIIPKKRILKIKNNLMSFGKINSSMLEEAKNIIFNKIQLGTKGYSAFLQGENAIKLLSEAISQREEMLLEIKNYSDHEIPVEFIIYGLEKSGKTDSRYKSLMEAIRLYSNDFLFFIHELLKIINSHLEQLSQKNDTLGETKIIIPKFTFNSNENIIFNDDSHKKWLMHYKDCKITEKEKYSYPFQFKE